MTQPGAREIAEQWFRVLKSAPYADSWNIEDSFVDKLAATWPWIQAYFEMLSTLTPGGAERLEKSSWVTTLGVYALQETLGLRLDCAAAFFMLLLISRVQARAQAPLSPEVLNKCAETVDRLVKEEDGKDWLKWIEEIWRKPD